MTWLQRYRSAERFFLEPEDRALADVGDFQGVGSKCGQASKCRHPDEVRSP